MHGQWPDPAADDDGAIASFGHQRLTQEAIDGTDDAGPIACKGTELDEDGTVESIRLLMADLPEERRLQVALDLHTECDPPVIDWLNLLAVLGLVIFGSWAAIRLGLAGEDQGFVIGAFACETAARLWKFGCSIFEVFGYRRFVARRSA